MKLMRPKDELPAVPESRISTQLITGATALGLGIGSAVLYTLVFVKGPVANDWSRVPALTSPMFIPFLLFMFVTIFSARLIAAGLRRWGRGRSKE